MLCSPIKSLPIEKFEFEKFKSSDFGISGETREGVREGNGSDDCSLSVLTKNNTVRYVPHAIFQKSMTRDTFC